MKKKISFLGISIVILSAMLCMAAEMQGKIKVTNRSGNDVSGENLIDSDMIHIQLVSHQTEPVKKVTSYTYRYTAQSEIPTGEEWDALKLSPFYKDMFFYRELENQWIRVEVELGDGKKLTHICGLKGGVLTAPPDDPILPHDWVKGMGWGGARNHIAAPEYREKAEGTAITMKRMGFKASRVHLPVEDYRKENQEVMIGFDERIKMQLRHGFCVALCGNKIGHYMLSANYNDEVADAMRTGWENVAKRYRNRSHRLAFAFFVELRNATNMDTLRAMHEDLTQRIRAITPNRILVYQGKSRNEPENFPILDQYVPGLGSPYYVYSFHKGFGGANNSWFRSEQDRNLGMIQPAVDYVNSGDTAVFMDVYNHVGPQARPEPYGHRVKHVEEMWKLLTSGRRPIPLICAGFFDSKFDKDRLYNPDGTIYDENPYARAAFEVLNGDDYFDENDWDGDGLSNQDEKETYHTDPQSCDTDNDNMLDCEEVKHGFDPCDPRDGLSSWGEGRYGGDADSDGIPNAWELRYYPTLNPFDPSDARMDSDGDGIINLYEIWQNTNVDSDLRGVGDEDGDRIPNLLEWELGANPRSGIDLDYDGLIDIDDPNIWVSEKDNVVRYSFETGGVEDTSIYGSVNTGSILGDAYTQDGVLILDGDGDAVIVPEMGLCTKTSYSIHIEFKAFSVSPEYQIIYKEGNATNGMAIYLYRDKALCGVWTKGGGEKKQAYLELGTVIPYVWHKIDVIVDGTIPMAPRLKGYFDSKSVGVPVSLSFSKLSSDEGTISLGGTVDETRLWHRGLENYVTEIVERNFFKGYLDFFNIYNCVLSDIEVQHLCGLLTPPQQRRAGKKHAPEPPTGLSKKIESGQVLLDWDDNIEGDLSYYNVKRTIKKGEPYSQIATNVLLSNYTDTDIVGDSTYDYVVTAIDIWENESKNSLPSQISTDGD